MKELQFSAFASRHYSRSMCPGVLLGILVGACRPVLNIPTLFQSKKMSFSATIFRPGFKNPYPISDLLIKTEIRMPVFT